MENKTRSWWRTREEEEGAKVAERGKRWRYETRARCSHNGSAEI